MGVLDTGIAEGGEYDISDYAGDDWWEEASDEDIGEMAEGLSAQTFWSTKNEAFKMGSAAGPIGGLIGAIVGTIIGIADADLTRKALTARLTEERDLRREIEADIEDAMNFRSNILRHAEALLHPVEQAFRTRARVFAGQISQRGLTGAGALAAQIAAENMYRENVGPHLPAVLNAAQNQGRADAMLALTAVEKKYGIDLSAQNMQLQKDMYAAELKRTGIGGALGGVARFGTLGGRLISDLISEQQGKNQQGKGSQEWTPGGGSGGSGGSEAYLEWEGGSGGSQNDGFSIDYEGSEGFEPYEEPFNETV